MRKLLWLWKFRNDPRLILLKGLAYCLIDGNTTLVVNGELQELHVVKQTTPKLIKNLYGTFYSGEHTLTTEITAKIKSDETIVISK